MTSPTSPTHSMFKEGLGQDGKDIFGSLPGWTDPESLDVSAADSLSFVQMVRNKGSADFGVWRRLHSKMYFSLTDAPNQQEALLTVLDKFQEETDEWQAHETWNKAVDVWEDGIQEARRKNDPNYAITMLELLRDLPKPWALTTTDEGAKFYHKTLGQVFTKDNILTASKHKPNQRVRKLLDEILGPKTLFPSDSEGVADEAEYKSEISSCKDAYRLFVLRVDNPDSKDPTGVAATSWKKYQIEVGSLFKVSRLYRQSRVPAATRAQTLQPLRTQSVQQASEDEKGAVTHTETSSDIQGSRAETNSGSNKTYPHTHGDETTAEETVAPTLPCDGPSKQEEGVDIDNGWVDVSKDSDTASQEADVDIL